MPGPRAVQNLQMPRRRGWQGRKMPRSSPGGLGAGGIDWCTMFYLPLSLSFLFSHLSTILLFSFLNFFYSLLHNFIMSPPPPLQPRSQPPPLFYCFSTTKTFLLFPSCTAVAGYTRVYTKIQGPRFERITLFPEIKDLHGTSLQSSPKINPMLITKPFAYNENLQQPTIVVLLIKILILFSTIQ